MRSDAAPALSQGISPTWTGSHTFNSTVSLNSWLYGISNPESHGAIGVLGQHGGYSGIAFNDNAGTSPATLMVQAGTNSPVTGMYNETTSSWLWYWSGGTLTTGTVPAGNIGGGYFPGSYAFSNQIYCANGWNAVGDIRADAAINLGDGSGNYYAEVGYQIYTGWYHDSGNIAARTPYGGTLYVQGPGGGSSANISCATCYQSSDERMKENIVEMEIDEAIEIIKKVRPVRYDWKAEHSHLGKSSLGFVAQELHTQVPELVFLEKPTTQVNKFHGIDYAKLSTINTSALQGAFEMIETMQDTIATLEARIKTLEATNT